MLGFELRSVWSVVQHWATTTTLSQDNHYQVSHMPCVACFHSFLVIKLTRVVWSYDADHVHTSWQHYNLMASFSRIMHPATLQTLFKNGLRSMKREQWSSVERTKTSATEGAILKGRFWDRLYPQTLRLNNIIITFTYIIPSQWYAECTKHTIHFVCNSPRHATCHIRYKITQASFTLWPIMSRRLNCSNLHFCFQNEA